MNDDQVLDALKPVRDPELGISIVDLDLVFRATRVPHDRKRKVRPPWRQHDVLARIELV